MDILFEDWGLIEYPKAYQQQRGLVDKVYAGQPGRLIFCEHPAVLTLGRSFSPESLLYSPPELEKKGVMVQSVDRGGDVTLHAPGQLVVYPILNLNHYGRDLKKYLEKVEQVAVDLLTEFGILAVSISGKRGVFVQQKKIVSIGIGVRKWVSYHGLGLNVHTDLSLFSLIKPCGLDVQMTSMAKELKENVPMPVVKERIKNIFCQKFNLTILGA